MYINTWQEEDDKARLFFSKNTQQTDKRQREPTETQEIKFKPKKKGVFYAGGQMLEEVG